MEVINLFDNRRTIDVLKRYKELIPIQKNIDVIQKFSSQKLTIENLRKKDVIILGSSYKGQTDCFFEAVSEKNKVYLTTGNLVGTLCFDNQVKVNVKCRFSKNDEKQCFFLYLLSKVFDIDFGEVAPSNEDDLDDLLLSILFVKLMEKAFSVGPFKKYKVIKHNDLCFKGKLDVNRHVLTNSLMNNKIAYTTNERLTDNNLNHLLLYVAKHIKNRYPNLIDDNKNARCLLEQIRFGVPTFGSMSITEILTKKDNLQSIQHPYYSEYYEELRKISIAILHDEIPDVFSKDNENSEVRGIIIDIAWLWEEYLFTLLQKEGYIHSNPAIKQNPIRLFKNKENKSSFYPDFRLPVDNQKSDVVLDAKYKLDENPDDIDQVFAYMLLTGAKQIGLIYPPQQRNNLGNLIGNDSDYEINQQMDNSKNKYVFQTFHFLEITEKRVGNSYIEFMENWVKPAEEMFLKYIKRISSKYPIDVG